MRKDEPLMPSQGEFVRQRSTEKVGIKSALMEFAALERDLSVHRISRSAIVTYGRDGRQLPFSYMNGYLSSQVGGYICDRKEHARGVLEAAGISVPPSEVFSQREKRKAWEFARSLNGPAVVKPTNMSRGKGITTGIESEEQLLEAWDRAFDSYRRPGRAKVLVERHMLGEDFRFYVVGDRAVFATHRKRANVTGDGRSTIAELIDQKNAVRAENPYLGSYLIPTSLDTLDRLRLQGRTLDDVPEAGEEVTLRGASNLSAGGDSIDYTDTVHPGFRELAIQAVKAIPGMQYAGVDIIAPSVTVEPTPDNYVIGEVEYSPAPITHFPFAGPAHDMAGALLDYYLHS
jgi:D-alanine-D-alanine ligase-like ATP-grasp enzyme